jgi:hypothetical protein
MRLWAILSFCVLLGAVAFAPARIGSMGFSPPDDANRHVAKAICGKPWNRILVMRHDITTDMHHGWDALLTFLHKRVGVRKYGLMAFSVSFCFVLFAAVPLFFLRRPESWLIVFGFLILFDPAGVLRFFLGRPFIIGCATLSFLLLTWRNFAGPTTRYGWMFLLIAVMACMAWLAPTAAYLFGIPLLGFALAREWRALVRLALCIAAGSCIGYALTGYPVQLVKNVSFMLFAGPDQHLLSRMLVTEFQPSAGNFLVLFSFIVLIVWRVLRKKWDRRVIDNPLFFNAVCGMFLGILIVRFWLDWGAIAAMLWLATEVDELLVEYFAFNEVRRFVLCGAVAVGFFVVLTADVGSRWTFMSPRFACSYEKAKPADKQWFPDSGGIIYNDNMEAFYQLFFDNPTAPWRYVVGFEPELMLPEDLTVYRSLQRMGNTVDRYTPWIDKMRPGDRMLLLTDGKVQPQIERLEWYYINRNTWFGRLPRKDTAAIGNAVPAHRGKKSAS